MHLFLTDPTLKLTKHLNSLTVGRQPLHALLGACLPKEVRNVDRLWLYGFDFCLDGFIFIRLWMDCAATYTNQRGSGNGLRWSSMQVELYLKPTTSGFAVSALPSHRLSLFG
jgi:hypothetical protein